jgi:competence protein ComFC
LCTLCRNQVPLTEYDFVEENAVDRIFYGRIPVEKAASFLYYSEKGIVKNLIHYLKYKNQPEIGAFLGDWWGQILKENSRGPRVDMVVPVPLHPIKQRKRGYNQVFLFGQRLAFHLGVPFVPGALRRVSNRATQTTKNRWYRWHGSSHSFVLSGQAPVGEKCILLVDDVITTGATIEACCRALREAGGVRVFVATMAVVP